MHQLSYGYIKDYTGVYIMNYKIVIETVDGVERDLNVRYSDDTKIKMKKYHNIDINKELIPMVFSELTNSLVEANIQINDIKNISFEQMDLDGKR